MGRQAGRRRLQPRRPGQDQRVPAPGDGLALQIPILFAYDTIHGYRTIFPIPLGAASAFDPNVASQDHKFGARESAAVGLKQIYSPMVDVSHEPRWGRISEAGGEDPYLNSVYAAARVKAAQGRDYSQPDKVVTSVKHYAAYGQPEGGRDYNTTDMSPRRLRDLYLPPFKAAIDAGADTAMCSFNSINGSPGCANHETETDILKKEWGFDGFIESDYTAVAELINHGVAGSGADAAAAALNAGTDSEMVSTLIHDNGQQLLHDGLISSRGSTTPCAGSCASSSAPGCSSTPSSTRRRPTPPSCGPTPWPPPARRPAARWCCSRTRASCRSARASRPRSSARSATTSTTCSARGGAGARTRTW